MKRYKRTPPPDGSALNFQTRTSKIYALSGKKQFETLKVENEPLSPQRSRFRRGSRHKIFSELFMVNARPEQICRKQWRRYRAPRRCAGARAAIAFALREPRIKRDVFRDLMR
ncbi:hypothetical protein EVAR_65404_1 [Eumeta japonica]|uniref:Uncharacterized protein n=1 Tax=Eumeta variegata TaxID=151549 RepID=A0A4C1ZTQ5_EUMVA|nr:hypothetical protein EVAR_65404_1 [Eumeta japonica]